MSLFVGIFASNIFVSIIMEAYNNARPESSERFRFKGDMPVYYTFKTNGLTIVRSSVLRLFFPNVKDARDVKGYGYSK